MFDFLDPLIAQYTWLMILLLVVGFVALVKGADMLVDGAGAVAKRFGVSDFVIGLTVVAFGTSMPELVVNIISAVNGSSELALTNILGSNSINIFVILGLTALVYPVVAKKDAYKVDIPMACLGAGLVMLFLCVDLPWQWSWGNGQLSRLEGALLLLCFIAYMVLLTKRSKNGEEEESFQPQKLWISLLLIVAGLAGLTIGGELIVKSATAMAHKMGVSDAVIGLTIVALGTSLPELATSVIAAAKKNVDLALGNCVGSCVFNIFFVLSVSAVIKPLPSYDGLLLDAGMALLAPAMVWIMVQDKKRVISRWEGGILLLVYAIYLTYRLCSL